MIAFLSIAMLPMRALLDLAGQWVGDPAIASVNDEIGHILQRLFHAGRQSVYFLEPPPGHAEGLVFQRRQSAVLRFQRVIEPCW
jgi:hypothetical protein